MSGLKRLARCLDTKLEADTEHITSQKAALAAARVSLNGITAAAASLRAAAHADDAAAREFLFELHDAVQAAARSPNAAAAAVVRLAATSAACGKISAVGGGGSKSVEVPLDDDEPGSGDLRAAIASETRQQCSQVEARVEALRLKTVSAATARAAAVDTVVRDNLCTLETVRVARAQLRAANIALRCWTYDRRRAEAALAGAGLQLPTQQT